jgi:tetratricopeptide (TPR) repeat protein
MDNKTKEWLVRTRTGEILGPYTQRDLFEELLKRTFTYEDEIAPSRGHWISAQTLSNREVEEFTHTSTRNQTITTKSAHRVSPDGAAEEELTPTPDGFTIKRYYDAVPTPRPAVPSLSRSPSRIGPIVAAIAVIFGLWALVLELGPRQNNGGGSTSSVSHRDEGDSPFVRQIYTLIRAGETQAALKQLTAYHEKGTTKGDLEYLIPYSALLITEGESVSRAQKFLEQVIASPQASPKLKSQAHHWLGYLFLSEGRPGTDMGESHFLEALQLNPKDAAGRFNLGRVYLKQEKFFQALDYLNLAEVEAPDLWLVHLYKGRAKVALGNTDEARLAFKTAILKAPDRWISYIYYALFLVNIHEDEAAQATLKKMLTRDPHYEIHSPPPWGFYQEKVDYASYLDPFVSIMDKPLPGKGLDEDREIGRLYINYLLNGNAGSEPKLIEKLADSGSLLAKVLALKVVLDRDGTSAEIKNALGRLPNSLADFGYYAYVLRGEARARLSQFDDSQSDFQKALNLEPSSAVAHWAYFNMLRKLSRTGEAQAEIKSLLSFHPDYIPAIVSSHNF